jgi:hypothetical protein
LAGDTVVCFCGISQLPVGLVFISLGILLWLGMVIVLFMDANTMPARLTSMKYWLMNG